MLIRTLRNVAIAAGLLSLTACGTTVEKQEARYKRAMDALNAVATKNPKMKKSIDEQKATFEADHKKVMAESNADTKKTELARLNSRIEEFTKKVDPDAKKAATDKKAKGAKKAKDAKKTDSADKKLKPATATPAPTKPSKLNNTAAPANKLGTPAPAGKLGGAKPAPGGKLGTAPAPAGKLGTAPAAPAGKLGTPPPAPAGKLGGQ